MKTNEPVDKKPWRSEELNDIIGDNIYHDKLEATKDNSLDKELDDILDEFQAQVEDGYAGPVNGWTTLKQEAKKAIKSKLDSQKAEAYERGYQHGHKIGYEEGISGYQPDTQSSQDREE